jgi:hypothetical protein
MVMVEPSAAVVSAEQGARYLWPGPTDKVVGPAAGFNTTVSVSELPPTAAVMTDSCTAVTAAAVAEKVVELEPAGTVTDAGTVSDELLAVRVTAAPPVDAIPLRMIVQVVDPAGARLDGRQARELVTKEGADGAGGTKVNVALRDAVPSDAVTVSLVLAVTPLALAVNAPDADPAAMTKDAGTVRVLLAPPIVSVTPPLGAAPLRVAVQLDVPGVVMEEGLHANELNTGIEPTVSVPPVALVVKDPPVDEAATAFTRLMLTVPRVMAGVMETVATTPSEMAVVFTPEARH